MTADSQWALQTAIHAALTGDATLDALVGGRIYDHTPQDSEFPYLVIGETMAAAFDTKTEDGMELTLTLHSWSRYRGLKEIKDIMAAVTDVLDQQNLSLTGHTLVLLQLISSDTSLDSDDQTGRHGHAQAPAPRRRPHPQHTRGPRPGGAQPLAGAAVRGRGRHMTGQRHRLETSGTWDTTRNTYRRDDT